MATSSELVAALRFYVGREGDPCGKGVIIRGDRGYGTEEVSIGRFSFSQVLSGNTRVVEWRRVVSGLSLYLHLSNVAEAKGLLKDLKRSIYRARGWRSLDETLRDLEQDFGTRTFRAHVLERFLVALPRDVLVERFGGEVILGGEQTPGTPWKDFLPIGAKYSPLYPLMLPGDAHIDLGNKPRETRRCLITFVAQGRPEIASAYERLLNLWIHLKNGWEPPEEAQEAYAQAIRGGDVTYEVSERFLLARFRRVVVDCFAGQVPTYAHCAYRRAGIDYIRERRLALRRLMEEGPQPIGPAALREGLIQFVGQGDPVEERLLQRIALDSLPSEVQVGVHPCIAV